MSNVHGVLVLNKPAGMTSHDCVARVRRLFRTKKAGHTGTLDPEVTGVLPICLGHATRLVEYIQDLPKAYEVVMRLGTATTTEDATGEVVEERAVDPSEISEERVRSLFQRFLGEIEQVPPMYSAVKVNGKRLYDLAREGVVVERAGRRVTIYDLTLHAIKAVNGIVELSFSCTCSKGTYVRTLCVDLGRALGYPAHMKQLVRVKSGPFTLADAVTLEEVERRSELGEELASLLVPIPEALSFLPRYQVAPERKKAVLNGLTTALPGIQAEEGSLICLFAEGQLLGIHRVCYGPKGPYAKPEKVFPDFD
jgi:tRNA pseudouridine55 synthase